MTAVWNVAAVRLPDGNFRLVGEGPEVPLTAWDPVTGAATMVFERKGWAANDIAACHPRGANPMIAVSHDDGVEWFDAVTGEPQSAVRKAGGIWGLAVGGTMFGAGQGDPFSIHRWDAATGEVLPGLGRHDDHIVGVTAFRLPGDTEIVAAGGWSHAVHRWDTTTGLEHGRPLTGHEDVVQWLDSTVLPDGRVLLVSGDAGGVVCRWDAVTGEAVGAPIRAHEEAATVLAVGGHVFTSGSDEVIRRWDAVTGELLGEIGHGFDPVLFTLDGRRALAAGGSRGLSVHPL